MPENAKPDKMHSEDFVQFLSFASALVRSLEHDREDRIVIDPFVEPLTRQIAPQLGPRMEKWTKGLQHPENYFSIRTRYLDDAITARGGNIYQVVLFRAGLDTRAYRLEALKDCQVFEVDQNFALFEHKVSVLDEIKAPLIPDQHEIVVADVNDFNWEEKLLSAGFNSSIPTFWGLEGQTMYLDRASNVALLKTIDILSATGSEIWGDVGGHALQEGGVLAFKQVDELSQAELGTHLFKLGEDDAIHGVFGELPWELELQADLGKGGSHFGRVWEPVVSTTDNFPVPFSFVHGVKK
ncbi:putative S-adenosyl-L-methionine-dependent methyltransferase SCO6443 [Phytophthora citrophthora]|uniref:S-adenosyl-L-methionine-dependent methyltransferase SCO6443 n=1 Tax=Phytophthora citrophthora TaxID=4793 RepID=A0AAD9LNY7_9STRA|nr:putative S-adenosyl-L-methionine-dependent methyltransferase SCO6443 [Phytophthora citrophthora]